MKKVTILLFAALVSFTRVAALADNPPGGGEPGQTTWIPDGHGGGWLCTTNSGGGATCVHYLSKPGN